MMRTGRIAAVQPRELLIFGAGGFGREVASWAGRARWEDRGFTVAAFIDDAAAAPELNGSPVLTLTQAAERFPDAVVLATVGNPKTRELLIAKAAEAGLAPTPPVIHPNVEYDREYVEIAEGVVICAGSILTVQISVKAHTQINLSCTVGHDTVIGVHSTLSPGVHISGNVTIEPYAFIGTGAVTVNGFPGKPIVIGEGSVVGAGAVVTKNVPAGVTVTGVPARPLANRQIES
jgi:sugar O-acyltransferase (sialic acid O-acetyltransferase NeuD family)